MMAVPLVMLMLMICFVFLPGLSIQRRNGGEWPLSYQCVVAQDDGSHGGL